MKFSPNTARSWHQRVFVVSTILALVLVLVPPMASNAGTLSTPRDYLNRQQASVTSGIQHQIFFTTGSAVSGGSGANSVIVTFPDADDGLWCRTAGSLTVTGIANPTGATETASALPGTLAGTCAQGSGSGAADSNRDRLIITGVDNLSATTKYGVQVVANTAALGTAAAGNNLKVVVKTNNGSTDVDSATLALSLISSDQVTVTATVDVTLSVTLSSNSVALGTLSSSTNSYSGITSQVSTSAANGYVSLVKYDATLTASGPSTIPNVGGTPPDNMTAGTSAYGASSSKSSQALTQFDADSNNCDGTTRNTANPVSASPLSTTFQSFASSGTGVTNDTTTLCFLATTSATQAPGTYTSTSTLVTTAKF